MTQLAMPRPIAVPTEAKHVTFEEVYSETFGYVFHALRRLGVQTRDLEDVVHDVFVAAHRHFESYDPSRPIKPWLFGFAYRTAADYRQLARHRQVQQPDGFDLVDMGNLPDEQLAQKQAQARFAKALDALDLERRAVFVMHDVNGHSMPEIAEALGVPLNTGYSRLRLARRDLEAALRDSDSKMEQADAHE